MAEGGIAELSPEPWGRPGEHTDGAEGDLREQPAVEAGRWP